MMQVRTSAVHLEPQSFNSLWTVWWTEHSERLVTNWRLLMMQTIWTNLWTQLWRRHCQTEHGHKAKSGVWIVPTITNDKCMFPTRATLVIGRGQTRVYLWKLRGFKLLMFLNVVFALSCSFTLVTSAASSTSLMHLHICMILVQY